MKFTLCAIGSWGDVAPFLTLGRTLRERGADVIVAAPPEFSSAAIKAGLDFCPIAPTCASIIKAASSSTGNSIQSAPSLLRATRILTEEVLAELPVIANGSQMIVATGIAYAAPHVSEALGIPYRAVSVRPRWYPSKHHPPTTDTAVRRPELINSFSWSITKKTTDLLLRGMINRWRQHHGLKQATDFYGRMMGLPGERILAAHKELAPLPADIVGVRQISAIESFQADTLSEKLEEFLSSGAPPVYFGFGSMHSEDTELLLDIVLKSSAALNIRALVPQEWVQSTGWRIPENTYAVGQEAFRHLFPRLAAVVHHGGAGTTTAAMLAGVPQVVIPHVMDQFYWGHRVHSLGIGSEPLNRKQFSQRLLTSKLGEVLCSSTMSERAHSLAVQLKGRNGALELAKLLLEE